MEKISRNILISVMFHSALLAAVFAIGSSSMQQTKKILMVSLFDEWQAGSADRHVNTGANANSNTSSKTEQKVSPKSTPAALPDAPAHHKPVERAERVKPDHPDQPAPANTQAAAMPTPVAQTMGIASEKDAPALVDTGLRGSVDIGYGYSTVAGDRSRETGRGGSMSSGVPMAGSGTGPGGTGIREGRGQQTGDIDPALRRKIRDSLQSNLVYPYLARKKHIEGTVLAEFRLDASGMPENMKIVKTSSYAILDQAAKETIQKAAPYPAHSKRVEIPITFRLQD